MARVIPRVICQVPWFKAHEDLLGAIGIALLQRTALLPGDAGGEHLRLRFLEDVVALLGRSNRDRSENSDGKKTGL